MRGPLVFGASHGAVRHPRAEFGQSVGEKLQISLQGVDAVLLLRHHGVQLLQQIFLKGDLRLQFDQMLVHDGDLYWFAARIKADLAGTLPACVFLQAGSCNNWAHFSVLSDMQPNVQPHMQPRVQLDVAAPDISTSGLRRATVASAPYRLRSTKTVPEEKAPINWTNMILFTVTPLCAVTLVPLYALHNGYDAVEWLAFMLLAGFCGISITAGYHRLWSHKTYKAHPLLRFLFALGGACALQNDVFNWASDHRRHHQHVDDNDRDPYSAGRGLWFSHIGWIIRDYPSGERDFSNIKDLQRDPILRWQHKHYLSLVLLMNVGLPAFLGYLNGDIIGMLLLAGLLRLVLSQHVTWLINSAAHRWGKRNYSEKSSARDNPVLALFTYGEGYHNYHHTFQWDYRNGIKWYHYDPTKWLIRGCEMIGLTSDLKRCSPVEIEKARLSLQYARASACCEKLGNADKLRERLEKEYEQLSQTLQLWYQHRQSWYAAKASALQEKWANWEHIELRDSYREIKYKLKIQRQRWQELMETFAATPALLPVTS